MKRQLQVLASLFILASQVLIGDVGPKYEFRSVWIATAAPDFPLSYSVSTQKSEIRNMLDILKNVGFNSVIFQVRPGCDAFYDSNYEPWSHLLTGTSGQAPSPFYDPLDYFISQAHSRGMELHAWFNPYRVSTSSNLAGLDSSHVYHQHPEWVLTVVNRGASAIIPETRGMYSNTLLMESEDTNRDELSTTVILDPGQAAVREYVINVFLDVVNRYAIDGVHMDDYFYPYGGMSNEDAATFAAEPRGFTDIHDWRRDNINLLVQGIYDSIQVVKPWVKYGVSPFGIWKNGVPPGIVGMSSYYDIYCDPIAWLQAGTVDYITPQLYWAFGGGQDYGTLMPWWADSIATHDRHLYVGHAPYRISDYHNWSAEELPNQIRLNRQTAGCQGSVCFRIRNGVMNNPKGFLDSLRNDFYRFPAIPPPMLWKDSIPPNDPCSVFVESNDNNHVISWCSPPAASDADTAAKYVIYRSLSLAPDVSDPANIAAIIPGTENEYIDQTTSWYHYAVSSLDKLNNESNPISATILGGISSGDTATIPGTFALHSNYPNPFNPTTTIKYDLPENCEVNLVIYDILGHQVIELVNEYQPAGHKLVQWNGNNKYGQVVSNGMYFYALQAGSHASIKKMIFLK